MHSRGHRARINDHYQTNKSAAATIISAAAFFMEYYQFTFKELSEDKKDMLVAMLGRAGFHGFEEQGSKLNACINEGEFEEIVFNQIIEQHSLTFSKSIIEEINWNAKWESDFEPVNIPFLDNGETFVHLRAGFHKREKEAVYDIEITPKMSFGTGHHATTYLVIQQMSRLNFKNKSVIDFGTGTGVLAILAEKMGASGVLAIDNDDWSINNAAENFANNGCERIDLVKAASILPNVQAEIILANINLNIILANLPAISLAAQPGATIIFSGMMDYDKDAISKALADQMLRVQGCFYRGGWMAICAKNS